MQWERRGQAGQNFLARGSQNTDLRNENTKVIRTEVNSENDGVAVEQGVEEVQASITGMELMVVETPNQVQTVETNVADSQEYKVLYRRSTLEKVDADDGWSKVSP